jgi:hypothetical protein
MLAKWESSSSSLTHYKLQCKHFSKTKSEEYLLDTFGSELYTKLYAVLEAKSDKIVRVDGPLYVFFIVHYSQLSFLQYPTPAVQSPSVTQVPPKIWIGSSPQISMKSLAKLSNYELCT